MLTGLCIVSIRVGVIHGSLCSVIAIPVAYVLNKISSSVLNVGRHYTCTIDNQGALSVTRTLRSTKFQVVILSQSRPQVCRRKTFEYVQNSKRKGKSFLFVRGKRSKRARQDPNGILRNPDRTRTRTRTRTRRKPRLGKNPDSCSDSRLRNPDSTVENPDSISKNAGFDEITIACPLLEQTLKFCSTRELQQSQNIVIHEIPTLILTMQHTCYRLEKMSP